MRATGATFVVWYADPDDIDAENPRYVYVTKSRKDAARVRDRLTGRAQWRTDVSVVGVLEVPVGGAVPTLEGWPVWAVPTAVCAHVMVDGAPGAGEHHTFRSKGDAVAWFRSSFFRSVGGRRYDAGDTVVMDLYPVCLHCTDTENHHDYPDVRYSSGPRGGVVRESV